MQLLKSKWLKSRLLPSIKAHALALACAFGLLGLASSTLAQSPFSAAYRVNSAVITHYEIDQTKKLIVALGLEQGNIDEQALNLLIDDRLLRQETARFGINIVDPVLVDRAMDNISNGDPERLRTELRAAGIDDESLNKYIESQILLRSYLDLRGTKNDVSPEEISNRIMQIPDQVTYVVNVAEIIMPYAEYGGRIPTRLKLSEVMGALRSGQKSFSQIAREVSRSPSAANGGRLPPIPREGLSAQLQSMIAGLSPGQMAAPIETEGAIIILQYVGPQEIRESLPRNPQVTYVDLFVPANGNLAASKAQAQKLALQVKSCAQARSIKPEGYHENTSTSALSSGLSLAIARLESGESTIFERENGTSLLFLCDRNVEVPEEYAQGVQSLVQGEAFNARARGALVNLRNAANIQKVQ